MELVTALLGLLQNLPIAISAGISIFAVIIVAYLHYRKVSIEDRNTSSTIQEQQIKSLMEQIKLLSDELMQARTQLHDIHNQNIKLMEQLRDANKRIGELEILLSKDQ